MKVTFAGWDERTLELAADRVTVGLEQAESHELRGRVRAEDLEAFEFAAAALCLAGLDTSEAPPQDLMQRLADDALPHVARYRTSPERDEPARPSSDTRGLRLVPGLFSTLGWLAAAVLLVAFVLRGPTETPSASARLDALRADATDLIEVPWAESETPWGAGVTGEVLWSADRQEGYMHFRGLDANDPGERQYQLWVFDTARVDWELQPVDGGVFDIRRGEGEDVVIPIDTKLRVDSAALFAVTLEDPGGVVVSKRERMVVTAGV